MSLNTSLSTKLFMKKWKLKSQFMTKTDTSCTTTTTILSKKSLTSTTVPIEVLRTFTYTHYVRGNYRFEKNTEAAKDLATVTAVLEEKNVEALSKNLKTQFGLSSVSI